MPEALWPYLVVLVVGALPNGIFRAAAVLLARGIDERSALFDWIRIVAIALLSAVVAKIVLAQPSALATVPVWAPILAVAAGVAGFFLTKRRLLAGLLTGEVVMVCLAWWLGTG